MPAKNVFYNILMIFISLFVFLNIAGGIVGIIWLLINGNWIVVLGAIALIVLIYKMYPIANFPTIYLMEYLNKRRKHTLCMILSVLHILWTFTYLGLLVICMFHNAITLSLALSSNVLPLFLMGYSVVATPFQIMATRESDENVGTFLFLSWVQISYVTLVLFYYIHMLWLAIAIIAAFGVAITVYLSISAVQIFANSRRALM